MIWLAEDMGVGRDQLLAKLKPSDMDETNREPCLPTTRQDVIKYITAWIAEPSEENMFLWVYGLAGSGKSTLSTTIAWTMRDLGRLGAFVFFNRDIPDRNAATLIRTLVYQLAMFDAHFGIEISRIVDSIPTIADMPLEFQRTNLLSKKALGSVQWDRGPVVLVIDALDECGTSESRAQLLQSLERAFSDLPLFLQVVVISRQEADIENRFMLHPAVHLYHLDTNAVTNKEDISEYFRHRFAAIRQANKYLHLDSNWPGSDEIAALTKLASGLFIWASTACSYIAISAPTYRLQQLIDQKSVDTSSTPFAYLDKLYQTALESAGSWTDSLFSDGCRAILGLILCARIPIPCSVIDILLGLKQTETSLQLISQLGCVLLWNESDAIRTLHPSFGEYLSKRCTVKEPWCINLEQHNQELAIHCINYLDTMLHENMCGLTLPQPVQSVTFSVTVVYACKFWVEHVCLIASPANGIGDQIHKFLGKHLLHWMEALAVLKSHDTTIQALQNLLKWLLVSLKMMYIT